MSALARGLEGTSSAFKLTYYFFSGLLLATCVGGELPGYALDNAAVRGQGGLEDRLADLWCKYGYQACSTPPKGTPATQGSSEAAFKGQQALRQADGGLQQRLAPKPAAVLELPPLGAGMSESTANPEAGLAGGVARAAELSATEVAPQMNSSTVVASTTWEPQGSRAESRTLKGVSTSGEEHSMQLQPPRWQSQDSCELVRMLADANDAAILRHGEIGRLPITQLLGDNPAAAAAADGHAEASEPDISYSGSQQPPHLQEQPQPQVQHAGGSPSTQMEELPNPAQNAMRFGTSVGSAAGRQQLAGKHIPYWVLATIGLCAALALCSWWSWNALARRAGSGSAGEAPTTMLPLGAAQQKVVSQGRMELGLHDVADVSQGEMGQGSVAAAWGSPASQQEHPRQQPPVHSGGDGSANQAQPCLLECTVLAPQAKQDAEVAGVPREGCDSGLAYAATPQAAAVSAAGNVMCTWQGAPVEGSLLYRVPGEARHSARHVTPCPATAKSLHEACTPGSLLHESPPANVSLSDSDLLWMGWVPNPHLANPKSSFTNPFYSSSSGDECSCPPSPGSPSLPWSTASHAPNASCSPPYSNSTAPRVVVAPAGDSCGSTGTPQDPCGSGGSSPIGAVHEMAGPGSCTKRMDGVQHEAEPSGFKLGAIVAAAYAEDAQASCSLPEQAAVAAAEGGRAHRLLAANSVGPQPEWKVTEINQLDEMAPWQQELRLGGVLSPEVGIALVGQLKTCMGRYARPALQSAGAAMASPAATEQGGEDEVSVSVRLHGDGAAAGAAGEHSMQHTYAAVGSQHNDPSKSQADCTRGQDHQPAGGCMPASPVAAVLQHQWGNTCQDGEQPTSTAAISASPGYQLSTSLLLPPASMGIKTEGTPSEAGGSGQPGTSQPTAQADSHLDGGIVRLTAQQFEQEVQMGPLLGVGGAGSVYRATWRGRQVAVKLIHPSQQVHPSSLTSVRREVQMLGRIGRHPHIAAVQAACLHPPHCCIVQELAEKGSLWKLIHEEGLKPQYGTLLQLAEDIALAICHCHSLVPPVVHRDLKSQNVLLGADGRARVCDFGVARAKNRTFLTSDQGALGTVAYMAPEVFSAGNVDEGADVWAFGVLLWEMLTGQQPWAECSNMMQVIMAVGVERRRLPIPADCPPLLRKLIKECWRQNAPLRPSFAEVLNRLRDITAQAPEQPCRTLPSHNLGNGKSQLSKQGKFSPALLSASAARPKEGSPGGSARRAAGRGRGALAGQSLPTIEGQAREAKSRVKAQLGIARWQV